MLSAKLTGSFMLVLVYIATTGCGANLKVKRIPAAKLDKLSGLAVNVNVPHEVIAVFPKEAGASEIDVEYGRAMLPSPNEIYELNYTGALFVSRELKVDLHPDTTIKRVEINSDAQTEESLSALTEAATQGGEIQKTFKGPTPQTPAQVLGAENEALKAEILNLMLKANLDAIERGDPPVYPGVGP